LDFIQQLKQRNQTYRFYDLNQLGKEKVQKLPYSLRILLENLLRNMDRGATLAMVEELLTNNDRTKTPPFEVPFYPARVLMQDFTGVPAIVDLAAMRTAVEKLGETPTW